MALVPVKYVLSSASMRQRASIGLCASFLAFSTLLTMAILSSGTTREVEGRHESAYSQHYHKHIDPEETLSESTLELTQESGGQMIAHIRSQQHIGMGDSFGQFRALTSKVREDRGKTLRHLRVQDGAHHSDADST